jgi:hypothetical protein
MLRPRSTALAAVLCLPFAVPAGAAASDAVYGGHLGTHDDPIVLTASAGARQLKSTVIAFTTTCDTGGGRVFHATVPVFAAARGPMHIGAWEMTRNAQGHLAGTYALPQNVPEGGQLLTMKLAGTLKAGSGSGTLSATSTVTGAPAVSTAPPPPSIKVLETCTTGVLRWTTAHRPGRVYGGRTAQGEPLVLRVAAGGRRIDDIDVGWHASCLPQGLVDFPETFAPFPVTAAGRFGYTFAQRYPSTGGAGVNFYDYDVHGTLGRTSARGTLRARVRYPDGTTCDTAAQSWKAVTG